MSNLFLFTFLSFVYFFTLFFFIARLRNITHTINDDQYILQGPFNTFNLDLFQTERRVGQNKNTMSNIGILYSYIFLNGRIYLSF